MTPWEHLYDYDPAYDADPSWDEGYEAATDELQPQIDALADELAHAKSEIERLTRLLAVAGIVDAA